MLTPQYHKYSLQQTQLTIVLSSQISFVTIWEFNLKIRLSEMCAMCISVAFYWNCNCKYLCQPVDGVPQ